jgi:hypothetical protein
VHPSPTPAGGTALETLLPDSGARWPNGPLGSAFARYGQAHVEIEGVACLARSLDADQSGNSGPSPRILAFTP